MTVLIDSFVQTSRAQNWIRDREKDGFTLYACFPADDEIVVVLVDDSTLIKRLENTSLINSINGIILKTHEKLEKAHDPDAIMIAWKSDAFDEIRTILTKEGDDGKTSQDFLRCPKCGSVHIHEDKLIKRYTCSTCGRKSSVTIIREPIFTEKDE